MHRYFLIITNNTYIKAANSAVADLLSIFCYYWLLLLYLIFQSHIPHFKYIPGIIRIKSNRHIHFLILVFSRWLFDALVDLSTQLCKHFTNAFITFGTNFVIIHFILVCQGHSPFSWNLPWLVCTKLLIVLILHIYFISN